jgi:hypothetical protein
MGNMKDLYFLKYADSGDQYVGQCILLLPVLHVDMAICPPYFSASADMVCAGDMVQGRVHASKRIALAT